MTTPGPEKLLYVSTPMGRNLWREYRIYSDHIELESLFMGKISIPLSDITDVVVRPPLQMGKLLKGEYQWGNIFITARLDLTDLYPHVAIHKASGRIRRIKFTPDDPRAFKAVLDEAIAKRQKP